MCVSHCRSPLLEHAIEPLLVDPTALGSWLAQRCSFEFLQVTRLVSPPLFLEFSYLFISLVSFLTGPPLGFEPLLVSPALDLHFLQHLVHNSNGVQSDVIFVILTAASVGFTLYDVLSCVDSLRNR